VRTLNTLSTSQSMTPRLNKTTCRFLDLGTGNGHMLFRLREDDDDDDEVNDGYEARWTGDMVGVDYSPHSVTLARALEAKRHAAADDDTNTTRISIQFEQRDILKSSAGDWLQGGFDIVLDKGTFDAISLMPVAEAEQAAPHPCEIYRERVTSLIKPHGLLVITSCNWTREELLEWLVLPADAGAEGERLRFFQEARYPTFTFGGQTGQSVVTLLLQR